MGRGLTRMQFMKKALVVVDIQKGFITKYTKGLPRKVQNFLVKRRSSYDLVIFTQYKNHPASNFATQFRYKDFMAETEYGIVPELKDFVSKKNVFTKHTYGSFVN